jgi:hypothetical protein
MKMNFKIRKGRHYSQLMPILLKESHFGMYKVRIEFDEIQPEQDYYNKLIGFGLLNPRKRSERIGWRFVENNMIELCCYSETNYVHTFIEPFTVPILLSGKGINFVEFYVFLCHTRSSVSDNLTIFKSINGFPEIGSYFPLFLCKPYHGGDPAAAQDYDITLTKIK